MGESKTITAACVAVLLVLAITMLNVPREAKRNVSAAHMALAKTTRQLQVPSPGANWSTDEPTPPTFGNLGVLPQGRCFASPMALPELEKHMPGPYDVYIGFAKKWHALPICPAKQIAWSRASERYDPSPGQPVAGALLPIVALCATIAANEEALAVEWAMYHLLLGVHRISIYPINTEQRVKLERVLRPVFDEARVWVNPVDSNLSEEWMYTHHVSFEKRTIAHCFRERLNGTDVVVHADMDEYVFPGLYPSIPALMAAELVRGRDELSMCVRYVGYGEGPAEDAGLGGFYLRQTTHSGAFCSNSKTAGMSRCVKKPPVKVRKHFVHELPMCCGCRSDPLIGTYLKKVAPTPCCRPSYFVAHMQHRDFALDSRRRKREFADRPRALKEYKLWHAMTTVPDKRLAAYGEAVVQAVEQRCFSNGSAACNVPLPRVAQP
eukprot:gene2423-3761_t